MGKLVACLTAIPFRCSFRHLLVIVQLPCRPRPRTLLIYFSILVSSSFFTLTFFLDGSYGSQELDGMDGKDGKDGMKEQ
jgi:hypothetical protein